MPQNRIKLTEYKGVEVRSAPQEVPQSHPNTPQANTPEGVDLIEVLIALVALPATLVGGVLAVANNHIKKSVRDSAKSRFRREMLREVRKEDDYVKSCNAKKPIGRARTIINVYGDGNTVNVNQ